MKDSIVACQNGFNAVLQEYHTRGLGEFLLYEGGVPVALNPRLNKFFPAVDTFDTPTLVYIRGKRADMDRLAAIPWDNAIVLAVSEIGEVYADIEADPKALAIYRSYVDWEEGEIQTETVKKIGVWA